jgi:hypothetical protein
LTPLTRAHGFTTGGFLAVVRLFGWFSLFVFVDHVLSSTAENAPELCHVVAYTDSGAITLVFSQPVKVFIVNQSMFNHPS